MASTAKQVIDNEIRKLLDSYQALEEEKQRHAIATFNAQQTQAIMDWLKKQDDEMVNALSQSKPPPWRPLKPDEWLDIDYLKKTSAINQNRIPFPNLANSLQASQKTMRFDPDQHVFRLRQPENLAGEEATRQAPLRVFAEQIITDVIDVVAGPHEPKGSVDPREWVDNTISKTKWNFAAKTKVPVIHVSPAIASVILSGCNKGSNLTTRNIDLDKYFLTPSVAKNLSRIDVFIIDAHFTNIQVRIDTTLENWQARVLFAPDDPKMIMPIIDNNFI